MYLRLRITNWLNAGAMVLLGWIALAQQPAFGEPRIDFDVIPTLACRDVTTESFRETYPGERLWEARFHVSALIREGSDRDLLQFFLRIESPDASIRIVDYEPKTTLGSQVAGTVGVQRHNEKTKSLGLAVTGALETVGKVTGNGAIGSKEVVDVRYELLPPQHLVASSGTLGRGSGAYFKLKPTRQSTLEGGKEYVVIFAAAKPWRGDLIRVDCEATAADHSLTAFLGDRALHRASFLVAMYRGGDADAKRAAEGLHAAETRLRNTARVRQGDIRKRAYPTTAHRLGAQLALVDARIPADWLDRLLLNPTSATRLGMLRLPEEVREAAVAYITAARRLEQLGADVERDTANDQTTRDSGGASGDVGSREASQRLAKRAD